MEMKTTYEEFAFNKTTHDNLRFLATAILASALEDADTEFLEDDYEEWKHLRLLHKQKNENPNEIELLQEFKMKQKYKDTLFDIAEIYLRPSDIPEKNLKERALYENNSYKNLVKLTGYKQDTLINVAKLHGWKIGCMYQEPTIFDL